MTTYKGKKVLVMGLGFLGGGVATTRWLLRHGALVTVTDLKTEKQLEDSIKALGRNVKKVRFVLGRHDEEDFRTHDFIVVNPGVPKESSFLKIAKKTGAPIINDAVLFFDSLPKGSPIIAVTGTRGKTTTTNWIVLLLKTRWPQIRPAGNTPENPLLKELERLKKYPGTPAVLELSSWQLEYLSETGRAPDVAVITNLYPDHMNRYVSMKEYVAAKANIFKNQNEKQILIMDDTAWMHVFHKDAKSKKYGFGEVAGEPDGIYWGAWKNNAGLAFCSGNEIVPLVDGEDFYKFIAPLGDHNAINFDGALATAFLASKIFNPKKSLGIEEVRAVLPQLEKALPRFRQETVYKKGNILIINDSASTSPEAGMAALRRFSNLAIKQKQSLFFISGGTDKNLNYRKLAHGLRVANQLLIGQRLGFHLYLLEGSATEKIKKDLKGESFNEFDDLKTLTEKIMGAVKKIEGGVVVFSPSAASFEKFKNEFDRGEVFNRLIGLLVD